MGIVLIAVLIMFYIHDTREKNQEIEKLKQEIEELKAELDKGEI